MVALRVLFIFLTSSALIEGQTQYKRVFNSMEIYNPSTGNHRRAADLPATRGRGLVLPFRVPCVCSQSFCKCCIGVRVKPFKVDKIVCVLLNFNQQVMEFQVQLTVGNWTALSFTVNAFPLPPICAPPLTPPLPIPLLFCLIIYGVTMPAKSEFQSCFALLLKLAQVDLVRVNLGCVRWGKSGLRLVSDVRLVSVAFIKPTNRTGK